MTYVSGFVTPVPTGDEEAYRIHAETAGAIMMEYGALRVVEGWGEDIPDGHTTDFRRSVLARDGESVVFSWMEFPDKATAEAAFDKFMADPRMESLGMPFDGKRMIWGGFRVIADMKPAS